MIVNNLYIGIPFGTLLGFLFLLFCFLNMPKTKLVNIFQMLLVVCILWIGGALLMRLQLRPGGGFWFQISLFGLLMLPMIMYFFTFEILQIPKNFFWYLCTALSGVIVIINAVTHKLVATPAASVRRDGKIGYTYTFSSGLILLLVLEFCLMVYATVLVYRVVGGEIELRRRLFPLFLGTYLVYFGQLVEMLPDNIVPFGSIGGLFMVCCFVYILYQHDTFDIPDRLMVGCIYTIAAILILFPIWNCSVNIKTIQKMYSMNLNHTVLLTYTALIIWSLIIVFLAWWTADGLSRRKKREQFRYLYQFQESIASLFNEDELYKKLVHIIQLILKDARVMIFGRKEKDAEFFLIPTCEADYGIDIEEKEQILKRYQDAGVMPVEFALLQYDEVVWGFIYLKFPGKVKMNYTEVEYFRQIAAYASICLKNINIYQEVYQNSIHDELTGLYNRTYYKEFIEKYWMPHAKQSLMYLDLDDFKLFNELYGEKTGDAILQWAGKVVSDTVASRGATFRIGSNEFLVYSRYRKKDELLEISDEIRRNLSREDEMRPKVLQPITMSIGIALFPDTAEDADELLKQAERAKFFAKGAGKNCIRVYEAGTDLEGTEIQDSRRYEQLTPTIYALTAAIDAKDSYTFEHSIHVSEYAVELAKRLGLSNAEVRIAKEAGLLHDIGKIGIPENILQKKGKLTDEEYSIMKTHVTNSIEVIHYLPNMNYVIPAVISHHERFDGKGYPKGIKEDKIPLLGRVLAICDAFEAIISKRPYKEAMSVEYAVAELENNKGTQFDPEVADTFIALIKEGKVHLP